jgi:septum formation protein
MNLALPHLILGSRSPRRSQLLTEAGFRFTIRIEETDESFDERIPVLEVAEMLACRKADALFATLTNEEVLLTADSVVIMEDQIFNKPEDYDDGRRILQILSGKKHTVATGVCLCTRERRHSFTVCTEIHFDEIDDDEIHYYLTKYTPYDKAGGYGIQDWIGVCKVGRIEGSYTNVMGLPVREVYAALNQFQVFPCIQ